MSDTIVVSSVEARKWATICHLSALVAIRRLEIAMNDALLMRVMHGVTNVDEQFKSLASCEMVVVAELRNRKSLHQLHDEIRSPTVCAARVKDLGNIWMVHHREGLTLRFKTSNKLLRVHSLLDDF